MNAMEHEVETPLLRTREGREGEILVLKLNRPHVLNAINWQLLQMLEETLVEAEADQSLRCLLIEGAGEKAFCSGADLHSVASLTPSQAYEWVRLGHRILNRLVCSRLPSIAAVRGYTLGGGLELALACDLRVAAESAVLGLPELKRGWLPGWGGVRRLAAVVGPGRARSIVLLGESVGAEDALTLGLVQQVVTDGRLASAAREIAARLADLPADLVREAKAQLNTSCAIIDEEAINHDAGLLAEAISTIGFQETTQPYR